MNNVKSTMIDIIGEYQPTVTTSASVSVDDGSFVPSDGIGSIDFVWILSAILLIVCVGGLISLFRALITGLLR